MPFVALQRSPLAARVSGQSPPIRQTPTCRGVFGSSSAAAADAALIENEEVEAGEERCDQGELLPQWSLRQAQRRADGEPAGRNVEEHEGAMVGATGEIETGDELLV